MSCHELHSWSFPALVGAFVDVAVAHLLLLAAATTFLASRLLSLLGFRLPCPCSISSHWCLRPFLSHGPHLRIASVHSSLAARHPFLACRTCLSGLSGDVARLNIGFCEGGNCGFEVEESCGSVRRDVLLIEGGSGKIGICEGGDGDLGVGVKESCGSVERDVILMRGRGEEEGWGDGSSSGSSEGRGKWRGSRKVKRRRRKVGGSGPCAPFLGCVEESGGGDRVMHGDSVSSQRGMLEGSYSPVHFRRNHALQGNVELSRSNSVRLVEQVSSDELGAEDSESKDIDKEILPDANRSSEETIRILRKALEEEQSARTAICLELEKERNASATATDEAMAMIERLQTEKASIDMNAKQYQRIIEEKTAYDEEEMELLKEIIVRRERELFVMGKEVEMYRQMILSCGMERQEDFDGHFETVELSTCMPNALKECGISVHDFQSTKMKGKVKDDYGTSKDPVLEYKITSHGHGIQQNSADGSSALINRNAGKSMHSVTRNSKVNISADDDHYDDHLDFQEKDIVSIDVHMSPIQSQNPETANTLSSSSLGTSQHHDFPQELLLSVDTSKNYKNIQSGHRYLGALGKKGPEESIRGSNSYVNDTEAEPRTFDVHIINDNSATSREQSVKDDVPYIDGASRNILSEPHRIRNIEILSDHSRRSWTAEEPDIQRSCSDATREPPHSGVTPPLDLRRSSMSAVDIERSKLETEVEDLRRRLKTVQQGRQKLSFSAEYTEKENFHHQLLDEIALQLREIKQLTDPQKGIHHTSLPPPSYKVNTKKRCCSR